MSPRARRFSQLSRNDVTNASDRGLATLLATRFDHAHQAIDFIGADRPAIRARGKAFQNLTRSLRFERLATENRLLSRRRPLFNQGSANLDFMDADLRNLTVFQHRV